MRTIYSILVSALIVLSLSFSANAVVTGNNVVTAQTPKAYKAQLTNGVGAVTLTQTTTAGYVPLVAGGTNGTKVMSLVCVSNDATIAHNIVLSVVRASIVYPIAVLNVPVASSTTLTEINFLSTTAIPGIPLDSDTNPYMFLEPIDILQVGSLTAITSPDVVSCFTVAADF